MAIVLVGKSVLPPGSREWISESGLAPIKSLKQCPNTRQNKTVCPAWCPLKIPARKSTSENTCLTGTEQGRPAQATRMYHKKEGKTETKQRDVPTTVGFSLSAQEQGSGVKINNSFPDGAGHNSEKHQKVKIRHKHTLGSSASKQTYGWAFAANNRVS